MILATIVLKALRIKNDFNDSRAVSHVTATVYDGADNRLFRPLFRAGGFRPMQQATLIANGAVNQSPALGRR